MQGFLSLFFSRNMSKLQTEALRLPVKCIKLVQVHGRFCKPPASSRMLILHPAPRASLRPFSLCDIRLCFKRLIGADVPDRNLCMCSLNSKSNEHTQNHQNCQSWWAPWSRAAWCSFCIHLGEILHYAACQSSPSVISLPNTCAGAGHWKVQFRGCCLSQEHFVNSGNRWVHRLI